jgi:ribosomal protein S26
MRRKLPPSNSSPILCEKCGAIVPKMTAAEVAAILKVSVKTVRNGGAGTDDLPREYYGGSVRFDRAVFEAWLRHKTEESKKRLWVAFAGHPRILARLGLNDQQKD